MLTDNYSADDRPLCPPPLEEKRKFFHERKESGEKEQKEIGNATRRSGAAVGKNPREKIHTHANGNSLEKDRERERERERERREKRRKKEEKKKENRGERRGSEGAEGIGVRSNTHGRNEIYAQTSSLVET